MKEFGVFNVKLVVIKYRDGYYILKPIEQCYALHADLAYGQGDFRGSPQRF